jgi:hypothetical protein
LLLPAVQSAREAARRAQCASHLAQLSRATHGFVATHNAFPSCVTSIPDIERSRFYASMQCQMLPYMEGEALFNAINLNVVLNGYPPVENETVARIVVADFLCPTDPMSRREVYGGQSYRANMGLGEQRLVRGSSGNGVALDFLYTGPYGRLEPLPVGAITDGLSNTIAYAEKSLGSGSGAYSPARDFILGIESNASRLNADDWLRACSELTSTQGAYSQSGRCWILHGALYADFFTSAPPNSRIPDCGEMVNNGYGLSAARSGHPGGVLAAMADGSVRWFTSSTDLMLWRALGTRSHGEVLPN